MFKGGMSGWERSRQNWDNKTFQLSVVKQRMQMCCSPYSSCTNCAMTVFKTEGAAAFYRSYTTTLVMNIPFQVSIHTNLYSLNIGESIQSEMSRVLHYPLHNFTCLYSINYVIEGMYLLFNENNRSIDRERTHLEKCFASIQKYK